jgi:hypothetical protein
MKKFVIAVALCAALAACKKEEPVPAADAAATPAADTVVAPAATDAAAPAVVDAAAPADAAAAAANSGLPAECENYLNRAKACFAKSSGNAAATAFQQAIDQSKAQWEAMPDKSGLSAACTQANDQFAQTVAMLKCE